MQGDVNGDAALLARCEAIRAHAAVVMGLAQTSQQATHDQPHTPKLALVSKPQTYVAANGRTIAAGDVDLNARIISMGKLHHAMTGTGAIAIAVAAAIPGTIPYELLHGAAAEVPPRRAMEKIRFGHPSGVTTVGAEVAHRDGLWYMTRATMSRSARTLMEGSVFVPDQTTKDWGRS